MPLRNVSPQHAPLPHVDGPAQIEKFGSSTKNSIPTIVKLFKSTTTNQINRSRNTPGVPVWQRNYYERVIRDEQELHRWREYIINNPANWARDQENPDAQEMNQPDYGNESGLL